MRQGTMRRTLAAASATAMAGAALVVVGAGTASAAPLPASGEFQGGFASKYRVTRTVSESSPTFGDVVNVRTDVKRTTAGDSLYKIHDNTPACFKYVPGSAEWKAGNAAPATEATSNQFKEESNVASVEYGGGWSVTDFYLSADYKVTCDAGSVPTGGTMFSSNNLASMKGSKTLGPTITVKRATVSEFFLGAPVSPTAGTPTTLRVETNAPEGSTVSFAVDGQTLTGIVTDGVATAEWTPSSPGTTKVVATFNQTATYLGKTDMRQVPVAENTVNSLVELAVPSAAQVGVPADLTATVSPAGAGGTVRFKEQGQVIDALDVPANGVVTTQWIPSVEGARTIDAEFTGRSGVAPSVAAGKSVNVAPKAVEMETSTVTLAPVGMTQLGKTVMLEATVNPAQAGGKVSFYDNGKFLDEVTIGQDGVATYEWTPAAQGQRTVRAKFSGTDTVIPSEATIQVTITSATDPEEPTDPDTPGDGSGSLGSLTGILGGDSGGSASGSTGSLSSLGS